MVSGFLAYVLGDCTKDRIEEITARAFDETIRTLPSISEAESKSILDSLIAFEVNLQRLRYFVSNGS
jgi:hypothetical protein